MRRLVKFEVLGQEYPLRTDAPEEEVEEILALVRSQLESAGSGGGNFLPANKVAVLATLNIAFDYVRLKKDFAQYREKTEAALTQLASKIE